MTIILISIALIGFWWRRRRLMVVDNDVEYLAEDLGIVENITLQDKDLFVKKNTNVILFLEFFKSMGFISLLSNLINFVWFYVWFNYALKL